MAMGHTMKDLSPYMSLIALPHSNAGEQQVFSHVKKTQPNNNNKPKKTKQKPKTRQAKQSSDQEDTWKHPSSQNELGLHRKCFSSTEMPKGPAEEGQKGNSRIQPVTPAAEHIKVTSGCFTERS